jgi:hypothetical protein
MEQRCWQLQLDRQGVDIENNTRRVRERGAGRELDWRRVAVTAEQAGAIEPIWKVDGRGAEKAGWAWEAESLGQAAVVALLRVEPLLTARELAERLGVSADWVLDHWEADELPGFRLGGGKRGPVRFRWSEVELVLESWRRGPEIPTTHVHLVGDLDGA